LVAISGAASAVQGKKVGKYAIAKGKVDGSN
jgi:hypothetical protein